MNPNKDRFPAILDINRPLKRLMPCNSTKKLNIVFQAMVVIFPESRVKISMA